MWKHIRRVVSVFFPVGCGFVWLSTHSVPGTIKAADSYLVTNLKWIGWGSPPEALASSAADHTGLVIGLTLTVIGALALLSMAVEKVCVRLWGKAPPDHSGIKERASDLRALVSLRGGLSYRAFWDWNVPDVGPMDTLTFLGSAASEFENYARNDAVTIWGSTGPNDKVVSKIPPDVWSEQLIDRESLIGIYSKTEYKTHHVRHPLYYRLAVNRKEIEELFPRPRFRRFGRWIKHLKNSRSF